MLNTSAVLRSSGFQRALFSGTSHSVGHGAHTNIFFLAHFLNSPESSPKRTLINLGSHAFSPLSSKNNISHYVQTSFPSVQSTSCLIKPSKYQSHSPVSSEHVTTASSDVPARSSQASVLNFMQNHPFSTQKSLESIAQLDSETVNSIEKNKASLEVVEENQSQKTTDANYPLVEEENSLIQSQEKNQSNDEHQNQGSKFYKKFFKFFLPILKKFSLALFVHSFNESIKEKLAGRNIEDLSDQDIKEIILASVFRLPEVSHVFEVLNTKQKDTFEILRQNVEVVLKKEASSLSDVFLKHCVLVLSIKNELQKMMTPFICCSDQVEKMALEILKRLERDAQAQGPSAIKDFVENFDFSLCVSFCEDAQFNHVARDYDPKPCQPSLAVNPWPMLFTLSSIVNIYRNLPIERHMSDDQAIAVKS